MLDNSYEIQIKLFVTNLVSLQATRYIENSEKYLAEYYYARTTKGFYDWIGFETKHQHSVQENSSI